MRNPSILSFCFELRELCPYFRNSNAMVIYLILMMFWLIRIWKHGFSLVFITSQCKILWDYIFELDNSHSELAPFMFVQIHLHAGTDAPLNVTFIRAPSHALLKVDVPLLFRGEDVCPGLRKGTTARLSSFYLIFCRVCQYYVVIVW